MRLGSTLLISLFYRVLKHSGILSHPHISKWGWQSSTVTLNMPEYSWGTACSLQVTLNLAMQAGGCFPSKKAHPEDQADTAQVTTLSPLYTVLEQAVWNVNIECTCCRSEYFRPQILTNRRSSYSQLLLLPSACVTLDIIRT